MKLTRLQVRDFGPHKDTTLELLPVNVLLGPNEQGKTFLLDAIHALKTGTARGVDVKDNAELTRAGAEGWEIEGLVGGEKVRRTRSGIREGTVPSGDPRVWRAIFEAGRFLRDMTPAERRELVASLTARPVGELVTRIRGLGAGDEICTAVEAGNLRRAYRLAEEARRDVDRDALSQRSTADAAVPDPTVETSKGSKPVSSIALAQAQGVRASCRKKLEDLIAAYGTAETRAQKRAAAQGAKAKLDQAAERVVWDASDEEKLTGFRRQAKGARELAAAAKAAKEARQAEADVLKGLLELGGCCPTCGQDVAAAKTKASSRRVELELQGAEREQDERRENDKAAEADRQVDQLLDRKEAWEKQQKDLAELRDAAEGIELDEEVEKAETQARADVARLDAIVTARETYDRAIAARDAARAAVKASEEKSLAWRQITEAVRPDRIEDEAKALVELNRLLEVGAEKLLGDAHAIEVGPAWEVMVRGRRAALASDSAQLRASFACAAALAQLSGLKLLVLDRLESVVGQARTAVLRLCGLLAEEGAIETAVLCCAQGERKPGPSTPWLRWFWVENGSATPL